MSRKARHSKTATQRPEARVAAQVKVAFGPHEWAIRQAVGIVARHNMLGQLDAFATGRGAGPELDNLSRFAPRIDKQRLLVGNASDVEIDGAGRILIPGPLRKFAGLEKDVALVGQGARFELWDEAKWAAQMDKSIAPNEDDIPPELEDFSL